MNIFIKYAPSTGDTTLTKNDNNCYVQQFYYPFKYFNRMYTFTTVCTNGFILLNTTQTRISPFESDLTTVSTGAIYYRHIMDSNTLNTLSVEINRIYYMERFVATYGKNFV
jgi:hypothetical protein